VLTGTDKGSIRIGMRKSEKVTNDWTCFDNVHLYYRPFVAQDLNGDGVVDTQDALRIYECIKTQTGTDEERAEDVNQDHVVDTQDVLMIYDYMNTH